MPLRRTPHGMSHGEAPAGPAHVVIKLKSGWQLDADGDAFVSGKTGRIVPELPKGAALLPAMPIAPAPAARGKAAAAQRELARFVHLRLPRGMSVEEGLEMAHGWEAVESAEPPASASLP
jgi:hypothetical protein